MSVIEFLGDFMNFELLYFVWLGLFDYHLKLQKTEQTVTAKTAMLLQF